jgi:flagellar hook-length control protein FliK
MPQINDKPANPRLWNPLLYDAGTLAGQPGFGELFTAHLQQSQPQTADRVPQHDGASRPEPIRSDERRPVPSAYDRTDPPRPAEEREDPAHERRDEQSATPPTADARDSRDTDANRTPAAADEAFSEGRATQQSDEDDETKRAADKADPPPANAPQAEAEAEAMPVAAADDIGKSRPQVVRTAADKVAAVQIAARTVANPPAKPSAGKTGKQPAESTAANAQAAAKHLADATGETEEPVVEAAATTRSDAAAKGQSGADVDGVAGTADAAKQGPGAKDAAAAPLRAAGTQPLATDRPPRNERREEKKEAAAVRSAETQPERPAARAVVAAPDAVKADAVAAAAEQMRSATGAPETDAAADAVQSASRKTTDSLPDVTARDGAPQTPRDAAPATEQTGNESSQIDRVRFVQRVARAFEALGDRGGTVRLRLSPPELGALRLEIAVRDGAMTAHLQADNPATRTLLLDNLPALRDRLAQQDIRIEQFHVDLMDQSAGGLSQQSPNQTQHQPSDGGRRAPPARRPQTAETPRAAAAIPAAGRRPTEGHRLDVII